MHAQAAHESESKQIRRHAPIQALGHRFYILLVLGFFTCGFHLLFKTVRLPACLFDHGLSVDAVAWTLGVTGLFNIVSSMLSGWLGDRIEEGLVAEAAGIVVDRRRMRQRPRG